MKSKVSSQNKALALHLAVAEATLVVETVEKCTCNIQIQNVYADKSIHQ